MTTIQRNVDEDMSEETGVIQISTANGSSETQANKSSCLSITDLFITVIN